MATADGIAWNGRMSEWRTGRTIDSGGMAERQNGGMQTGGTAELVERFIQAERQNGGMATYRIYLIY